jgi:hypothetical protein
MVTGRRSLWRREFRRAERIGPAFVFLAIVMLAVALAYVFFGIETHGKPMARSTQTR